MVEFYFNLLSLAAARDIGFYLIVKQMKNASRSTR